MFLEELARKTPAHIQEHMCGAMLGILSSLMIWRPSMRNYTTKYMIRFWKF